MNENQSLREAAEQTLNLAIDSEWANCPDDAKSDFAKKKDGPTRSAAINAMLAFHESQSTTQPETLGKVSDESVGMMSSLFRSLNRISNKAPEALCENCPYCTGGAFCPHHKKAEQPNQKQ